MRIIARGTLREFWEKKPETEVPLKLWYIKLKKASWNNNNELKMEFPSASIIGNDRVVFNIKGNNYRLIAAFDYEKKIVWIRFIGTHNDYDKIDAKTI